MPHSMPRFAASPDAVLPSALSEVGQQIGQQIVQFLLFVARSRGTAGPASRGAPRLSSWQRLVERGHDFPTGWVVVGVQEQSCAVYQFRHALIQDHLAGRNSPSSGAEDR